MSNLLKFNSVVIHNNDKMVIDSNRMVDEIIEHRRMISAQNGGAPIADEDGFVCGLDAAMVEQLVSEEEQAVTAEPYVPDFEKLREQEEEILRLAREDAEVIREEAQKEGFEQGIADGRQAAEEEFSRRMQELESEFAVRTQQLEEEYARMRAQMEPELVETLLDVFSKVTYTIAENKRDLVLSLVNGVLKNTEMSKEYIIKVSEEDYSFLIANKELINKGTSKDVKIDVCVEPQLKRNQCIIESDIGVFDCSLDIQLENLISDIKVLSCLGD